MVAVVDVSPGAPSLAEEPAATSLAADVTSNYPANVGLKAPSDKAVSFDASSLFSVLSQMGASIAAVQKRQEEAPPWLGDMRQRLDQVERLEAGFGALTEVVGTLASMSSSSSSSSKESGTAAAALAAIKDRVLTTTTTRTMTTKGAPAPPAATASALDESSGGALLYSLPDEAVLGELGSMRSQLLTFERIQAEAPLAKDVEELKEFVKERTRNLKATLVTLQSQMERKFDTRMKQHLHGFDKWQADLMAVTSGRLATVDDRVTSAQEALDAFRAAASTEHRMGARDADEFKEYCGREFASGHSQTLGLQMLIHTLTERVAANERTTEQQRRDQVEWSRRCGDRVEAALATAAATMREVERSTARLAVLEARCDDLCQDTRAVEAATERHGHRLEAGEAEATGLARRVDHEATKLAVETEQRHALHRAVNSDRDAAVAEAERLDGQFKAHKDEALRLENLHLRLKARVVEIQHLTQDTPAKIEFLLKRVDDQASTSERLDSKATRLEVIAEDAAATRLELKRTGAQLEATVAQADAATTAIRGLETRQAATEAGAAEEHEALGAIAEAQQAASEDLEATKDRVRRTTEFAEKELDKVNGAALKVESAVALLERVIKEDDHTLLAHQKKFEVGSFGQLVSANKRSGIARKEEATQKRYVETEISTLVESARNYIQLCARRNVVAAIPQDVARTISDTCIEMANYMCEKVDMWAIEELVKEQQRPSDDATPPFSDDAVAARKKDEQHRWIQALQDRLDAGARFFLRPGEVDSAEAVAIRLRARETFFKRVDTALSMALSRHDQVIVSHYSTLKRVSLPHCITCERPLPFKKAFLQMHPGHPTGPEILEARLHHPDTINRGQQATIIPLAAASSSSPSKKSPSNSKGRAKSAHPGARPVSLRGTTNPTGRPLAFEDTCPDYVLRAGFKLPSEPAPNIASDSTLPRLLSTLSATSEPSAMTAAHHQQPGDPYGYWN